MTAQFGSSEFSAGGMALGAAGYDYHPLEAATGGLFRIRRPNDWSEEELYDFDWSELKNQTVRIASYNYNA
jgi:hypothetical protein